MDALQPYAAFARTFEAGSFSAVAREMGTSQSAISKQIAALEVSLGVQLFARTTRRLQPTGEALRLYEHVRQLLDAVEMLKSGSGAQIEPSGLLRFTLPSAFGRLRICPLLPEFMARYPHVRLEAVLNDQVVDLVEEGHELGIRIGHLSASTLVARPIGTTETRLVATSQYLAAHGSPESPAELAAHACLVYGASVRWRRWEFESENGRQVVEVEGPACVNDPQVMYEWVCAHRGIALVPEWVVGDGIASGRVEWLLPDFYPLSQPVHVVTPQSRFLSRRARCFIDFLTAKMRGAQA
jgi:DNA-binding transcriptional LysR family regulator